MRLIPNLFAIGLAAAVAVPSAVAAQDKPALNPADVELPRSITRIIKRSGPDAAERLGREMFEVDPEGKVSDETIARYEAWGLARTRAKELADLLQFDLNFDGTLSKDELTAAHVIAAARGRHGVSLGLLIAQADTNADGSIGSAELFATIRAQHPRSRQRISEFKRELRVFDLDLDGVATLAEMVQVVNAYRVTCDC
ncbi:MAG: hypothetical protein AAGM84_08325 [Pseudomonadota bacterium]